MERRLFTVKSNSPVADGIFRMELLGDASAITAPGQFINIEIDGLYLRRPISVFDWSKEQITIIYKVVGEGTKKMSLMNAGAELDILVGLGNGFDTALSGENPLLIGGGVGTPPLYGLAKALTAEGKKPTVILGFGSKSDAFAIKDFEELGLETHVATADGTLGTKGFVTDIMPDGGYSYFYTCGPLPMLKAVFDSSVTEGQLSFEERMGCGFGACMGCTCKTKYGNKRICRDGPVLLKEEVIW